MSALLWGAVSAAAVVPGTQSNCLETQAATFSTSAAVQIPDPPVAGPTVAPATSTVVVSGLAGAVYDVDVTTKISHAAVGDLMMTLTSPSGAVVELSVNNGGQASNVFNGTLWDDDADPDGAPAATTNDGLVTDHNYVNGVVASPLVPQGALSDLMGDVPNGVWALTVHDSRPGHTGSIDAWSLSIAADVATEGLWSYRPGVPGFAVHDGGSVHTAIPYGGLHTSIRSFALDTSGFVYTGLGDLTLVLESPAGTRVTLTSRNGGAISLPTGNRHWHQLERPLAGGGGPKPLSRLDFAGELPFGFAPEESFGAFVGENPRGTWTLYATDAGLIPGGGIIGSVNLYVKGNHCQGAADLVSERAQPEEAPIGTPVSYTVAVPSVGAGPIHDVELTAIIQGAFRVTGTDPGVGGTCSATVPSRLSFVTCRWPGPTAPGAARRVRIAGEGIAVSPLSATASVQALRDLSGAPPGSTLLPILPSNLSASLRLSSPTLTASARRASNGQPCTAVGTQGDDVLDRLVFLLAAPGPQVYCGLGGKDRLSGSNGADVLDGGAGDDVLIAGRGNDRVDGGTGADFIEGGDGDDDLRGGDGGDALRGAGGSDRLAGGRGADRLTGGQGSDTLLGGPGSDRLRGDTGQDHLVGGPDPDILIGGAGRDFGLRGARDRLFGIELPGS